MARPRSTPLYRINHEAVGERIKTLRLERGYSQQEVAGLIGVRQHSLSNLERGHTQLSLELAVIIAETFGVSVEVLVVKM